jgi:Carboxypeptidase regulatory-like domain
MTRSRRIALLIVLVLGCMVPPLMAQTAAEVHGVVTDETGGVIVGASVTLTGERGANTATTTGPDGRYRLVAERPGKGTVTIEAKGFARSTRTVSLTDAESTPLDIILRVAINERVDVRSGLVGVSLDSAQNLSGIRLSGRQLEALPDDPESLLHALRLLAATTGTRPDLVMFYVDGLPLTQRVPPKDIIQSVRINANPFSAEFAEPGASRVEILTKPASGHYHGNGRIDFNDARLNSRNLFEPTRARYQTRTYEGYIGGPIVRNRLGFLAYAGRWDQDENMVVNATPIDPITLQPHSLRLNVPAPTRTIAYALKADVRVTENHTSAVEYGQNEQDRLTAGLQSGFDLPERAYTGQSRERTVSLWVTSAFPKVLNEFRARVSRNDMVDRAVTETPAIIVLEAFNSGGNQDWLHREDRTQSTRVTNVTTLAGPAHSIRVGGEVDVVRLEQVDRANSNGTFIFGSDVVRDALGHPVTGVNGEPSVISGLDLYRLVLGRASGYRPSQFSIVRGDPAVGLSIIEGSWFAQDDWRPASRLTISYGIRHEIQHYGDLRMGFAPRAGLAWAPGADGNSAVRAGVGLFYTQIPHQLFSEALRLDGRHAQRLVVDRPEFFPGVPDVLPGVQNVTATLRTQSPGLAMPMTLVSTVSYDRRLVGSVFGSIGYTWRRGMDLLRTRSVSAAADSTTPNALIMQFESTGRSSAHEVNATVSGNIGPEVTVFGSYGFTRAMQDTDGLYSVPADSSDLAAEWSLAPVPQHRISVGGTINLPDDYALYPFITWASAVPFNITSGNDTNLDSVFTDRPSLADVGEAGAIATPFGVFNPNPRPGEIVIPRNFGRGPTNFTFDVTAAKTFARYTGATPSSYRATVLLSVSNLLNHTNYAPFNGVLTSPFFGTANRALNPRRVTLGLRYDF